MATSLTPHIEHFDGIYSAVMCPATAYWHKIMLETIVKACNDIGFDGVCVAATRLPHPPCTPHPARTRT